MTSQPAPAAPDEELLRAVELLLRPLARLFLEQGLVFGTVEELIKAAYVKVAAAEFGLDGQPPSDSRIAVLSGVHRKDVRRINAASSGGVRAAIAKPFASEVVTRWISDRRYRDARGKPRVLPRTAAAGSASFDELVASVSTDVRPRVLLDELSRLGVVAIDGGGQSIALLMSAFVPQKDRGQRLFYLGRNLHDHIAACIHNLVDHGSSMMEQSVFSFELSPASITAIGDEARRQWQAALAILIPAIGAREEADRAAGTATERINIGMYCFHEPAHSPASHGPPPKSRHAPLRGGRTTGRRAARSQP